MHREGVIVESDGRLGLDRQPGARCAVVIARRDIDRESFGGADRPVRGGELDLELRRDKIFDTEFGGADRRRLRVETQLDPPSADARIARQGETLPISAHLVARQLMFLDFDPVRPQQSQSDG